MATFEASVKLQLLPRQSDDLDFQEIKARGLTWAIRAQDTKVRVHARKLPGESDNIFLGTVIDEPNHWSRIILSGARAGCKLHFSFADGTNLDQRVMYGIKSTLDVTTGSLKTALVGSRFRGDQAQRMTRNLKAGDELKLKPEKDNPHDPRAIAVMKSGLVLGYVARTDHPIINFILSKRPQKIESLQMFSTKVVEQSANPSISIDWTWPS